MSLVVVINCGAENALHSFEKVCLNFYKAFFIHTSKDILRLRAQNATKQCKLYFSRKPQCQVLRKFKIGKSDIIKGRTAAPYIMHDF